MPFGPHHIIDRISARQFGLVLRRQALAAGLTPRQIDRLLATGRWVSVARGLYRVAAAPVSWRQDVLAACLARPDRAVASHLTAAALHGLARPPRVPHIIAPPTAEARSRLAVVHRARLHRLDRAGVAGIPTTAVARTLIDCAAVTGDAKLGDLVDSAFCGQLSHPKMLSAAIDRAQSGQGKPGVARLRRVVEVWTPGIEPGSPAEMRLLRQIDQWGFPAPESQIKLRDGDDRLIGRIDLGWRAAMYGLEYDGDRTHNPRQWARDEPRHARYETIGWQVDRVDKYDLRAGQPRLRELLERRLRRLAA